MVRLNSSNRSLLHFITSAMCIDTKLKKPALFLLVILFAAYSFQTYALNFETNRNNAVQWINSQLQTSQEFDNSVLISNRIQAASEVLHTFAVLNQNSSINRQRLLNIVRASDRQTESIARQILINLIENTSTTDLIQQIVDRANLNSSGSAGVSGLGTLDFSQATSLDSAWALLALSTENGNSIQQNNIISFLLDSQNQLGAFGNSATVEADIYTTSLVVSALTAFDSIPRVGVALQNAVTYLESQRNNQQNWGSIYLTSWVLNALISFSSDPNQYQQALNYLADNQLDNGSWDNDLFSTAVTVRVLRLAEVQNVENESLLGGLSGRLVDSSLSTFISGAAIKLVTSESVIETITNANGRFTFNEVPVGIANLEVNLSGFRDINIEQRVTDGVTSDIGDLLLVPSTGMIRGVVADSVTNRPLVGARVNFEGTLVASVLTDQNGRYEIQSPVGSVDIRVELTGYRPVSASAVVSEDITLFFSPALNLLDSAPDNDDASLRGTIVDSQTGAQVENALITLPGSSGSIITSDAQGRFVVPGLSGGLISIQIEKDGYFLTTLSVAISQGVDSDIGNISLTRDINNTEGQVSLIEGSVLDEESLQVLDGVRVTLDGQDIVQSSSEGIYQFMDIIAGEHQLEFSKDGFISVSIVVDIPQGSVIQISPIRMRKISQDDLPDRVVIQGLISDSVTGLPIAGVSLSIVDSQITTLTSADGTYVIDELDPFEELFLDLSAPGYLSVRVSLTGRPEQSEYLVDLTLTPIEQDDIGMSSIVPSRSSFGAFEEIRFNIQAFNTTNQNREIRFFINVTELGGNRVSAFRFDGVSNLGSSSISANTEGQLFDIALSSGTLRPGNYVARISFVEDLFEGDFSGNFVFVGQVFDVQDVVFTIDPTRRIERLYTIASPSVTNFNSEPTVQFSLNLIQAANINNDVTVDYQWFSPGDELVRSGSVSQVFTPNDVRIEIPLDEFDFKFTEAGQYRLITNLVSATENLSNEVFIQVLPPIRLQIDASISPTELAPSDEETVRLQLKLTATDEE